MTRHQYWLWYLYNPKVLVAAAGNHEGDWEFVQIGSVDDTPVCMTNSQHNAGSARMWWDVKLRAGRPVVYVAVGSHANYFAPVSDIPGIGDDGDGAGETLDALDWRDFGAWDAGLADGATPPARVSRCCRPVSTRGALVGPRKVPLARRQPPIKGCGSAATSTCVNVNACCGGCSTRLPHALRKSCA